MIGVNWLTDVTTDFEYKKYKFLAYYSEIKSKFQNKMLYPHFTFIKEGYNQIIRFTEARNQFNMNFPKEMVRIELGQRRIKYVSKNQSNHLSEVNRIIEYIRPLYKDLLKQGNDLEHIVQSETKLEQVGVFPLYQKEGFIFLHVNASKEIEIFKYNQNLVYSNNNDTRVCFKYLFREKLIKRSILGLKRMLVSEFSDFANPATFICSASEVFPFNETFLPASKMKLAEVIS